MQHVTKQLVSLATQVSTSQEQHVNLVIKAVPNVQDPTVVLLVIPPMLLQEHLFLCNKLFVSLANPHAPNVSAPPKCAHLAFQDGNSLVGIVSQISTTFTM